MNYFPLSYLENSESLRSSACMSAWLLPLFIIFSFPVENGWDAAFLSPKAESKTAPDQSDDSVFRYTTDQLHGPWFCPSKIDYVSNCHYLNNLIE